MTGSITVMTYPLWSAFLVLLLSVFGLGYSSSNEKNLVNTMPTIMFFTSYYMYNTDTL